MFKLTIKENLAPLENLARRARELDGQQNVPLGDLLTPAFVRGCSRFESADELFQASGFKIDSPEDFKAIPDEEWDVFIRAETSYSGWDEMLREATGQWVKKQLSL